MHIEEKTEPVSSQSFREYLNVIFGSQVDLDQSLVSLRASNAIQRQIDDAIDRVLGVAPKGWEWQPLQDLVDRFEEVGDFGALMSVEQKSVAPPLPDGSENCNPQDISFISLVLEDYRTNDSRLLGQGFLTLFIHRFGNLRMSIRFRVLRAIPSLIYRIMNRLGHVFLGIQLDYTVKVGRRVKLEHFGGMILIAREIGNDVWIRQNTTFGVRTVDDLCAKPIIGNSIQIGAGAVIVGNITIGDNSIIGANTLVTRNVPPNSVVIGVPGQLVGKNTKPNPSPLTTK